MTGDHRNRLARLCEQLAGIHVVAERAGLLAALEAILTELRAGGDTAELTGRADELLRRCGVARGLGDQRSPGRARIPYLGGGHPVEEAHVCPVARCDRVALDGGGTCALFGEPLRPVRL
ncbi:hypothetical protein AB0I00_33975 [Streptomyces sp. NPDC050803]|uniref:hypothetical protein n=1 Tax=unclassified Streptomyces TaxID=2593676 RepID=UPI00342EE60C